MNGKGDKRRPTDEAAYADNYERIFGNGVRRVSGTKRGSETAGPISLGQGEPASRKGEAIPEMDASE